VEYPHDVIARLQLRNFKAFSNFSVTFGPESLLVGPNSAGKSTIIAALRASAQMMRQARHRSADRLASPAHGGVRCYGFSSAGVQLISENLRHEFRNVETQIEVGFKGGSSLTAVWPVDEDDPDEPEPEPFFILRDTDKVTLHRPKDVRRAMPDVAVVPSLSPVEHEERILEPDYVRSQMSGRLASRHFRNHLYILAGTTLTDTGEDELTSFISWAEPWITELVIRDLVTRQGDKGRLLDLFCTEHGSHSDRELFWIGDGMQVWLQLLAHLYRAQSHDTIILDEPDLYLHADLQRRLIRLLESLDVQTIAASHSAELLTEAAPRAVTWIAKERRQAVRAPDERLLGQLSDAIGSQFNLRLARTLRARAVLFVEGDDLSMLRHIARTLGAGEFTRETALVTVPLRGFSNWEHVEPFSWLLRDLLEDSVRVLVILDRDYRTPKQCEAVRTRLRDVGVDCHVWHRKELESYLLEPAVIGRIVGATTEVVRAAVLECAEEQKAAVFARQLAERTATEVTARRHAVNITEAHQRDFDKAWRSTEERPYLCNAKTLLASLNRWLTSNGYVAVGADQIARKMTADEIPEEMGEVINTAEALPNRGAGSGH
jgi:energy-coupling factor transporter ATP-binding protein EcfA2